jgi:enoyl-[acyl-carrier protein] reductase II
MEKSDSVTEEQVMAFGAGSLRKAAVDGNIAEGSFMAGQIAGMIKSIRPAKEIIESMVKETEEILSKANNRLS